MSDPHFSSELSGLKKRLAGIFAVAAACILTGGFAYHHHFQRAIRKDASELLSSIRQLKADQIVFWRSDRINDTNSLLDTPVLSVFFNRLALNPTDKELQAWMRSRLQAYLKYNSYTAALLAWPDGRILISAGDAPKRLEQETKDLIAKSAASGKVELGDFYLGPDGKPHLDVAGKAAAANGKKLFLVLKVAPSDYLYPMIAQWPTNSATGEVTLGRRDGDSAVALNEFRYDKTTPLRLRDPLDKSDLPIVKALKGETGVVFAKDYRGRTVLASIGMIPGSDWGIAVKMDWEEILADAGQASALILLFTLAMLVAAAVTAYLLFRLQASAYTRSLLEIESEKEKYRINLETLTDRANDMILLSDPEKRSLLMVNRKACETYGYTEEEMLKLRPEDMIPPEDLGRFNARYKALAAGQRALYEVTHMKKNGERFRIEVSATGIRQDGRDLIYFICRDITERRRLEAELKEKERKLAGIMGNLPGMAYRCKNDPNWTLDFVSPGCEPLTGYKAAELIGNNALSYSDLIVPSDRDKVWREVQEAIGARRPFRLLYRIRRKDGQVRTVWEQGAGIAGENGKAEALEGLIMDSTDKAAAETALRESQESYQHLFETMDEGFACHEMIYDGKGRPVDYRFLEANPAFERLTGLKRGKILGKRVLEVLPNMGKAWIESAGEVALTGKRIHFETRYEELGKWFEVSAFSPRRGQFATTFFDITSRKEAELRSEELNRDLAKNLRLYTMLAQINQAAALIKDRKQLLEKVCDIAVVAGGFKMAWVGSPDKDTGRVLPLCSAGSAGDYLNPIKIFMTEGPASKGPTGEAARTGRISACQDIAADPRMEPWREKSAERGFASSAAIPLYDGDTLTGVLSLYSAVKHAFTDEEIKMLAAIQAETGLAIEAISAEEKRAAAQAALERTAKHLSHALETTPVVLFTLRQAGEIFIPQWVSGNPREITGHDPEEILSPDWFPAALHPEDRDKVLRETADVLKKGSITRDFRLKKKDGSGYAWVRNYIKVSQDGSGEIIGAWTDITELKESELRCLRLLESRPPGDAPAPDGGV
ncbi:MAG: PAS domain S-box protein [Elusimicrobiales bacterium]